MWIYETCTSFNTWFLMVSIFPLSCFKILPDKFCCSWNCRIMKFTHSNCWILTAGDRQTNSCWFWNFTSGTCCSGMYYWLLSHSHITLEISEDVLLSQFQCFTLFLAMGFCGLKYLLSPFALEEQAALCIFCPSLTSSPNVHITCFLFGEAYVCVVTGTGGWVGSRWCNSRQCYG